VSVHIAVYCPGGFVEGEPVEGLPGVRHCEGSAGTLHGAKFAALTPAPAVALVTPFAGSSSGPIFQHWALQTVLLGFRVLDVFAAHGIVRNFLVFSVEMTTSLPIG